MTGTLITTTFVQQFTHAEGVMMMKRSLATAVMSVSVVALSFAGDVTGSVKFAGAAPKGAPIQMAADPICKKAHKAPVMSEEVVVGKNGGLANVMVYVTGGLKGKQATPTDLKVFDQIGCVYTPHVLTLSTDQEVEIRNSDPTLHNVHSLSKKNPSFNQAQPMKGMKMKKKFGSEEYFKVKCEVHPWMGAYIGVFAHPYHTVTDENGSFNLKGLPAGEYTIEARHEKFGTQTAKVKVDAAGSATVDFSFKS
jgi:plastocyanin